LRGTDFRNRNYAADQSLLDAPGCVNAAAGKGIASVNKRKSARIPISFAVNPSRSGIKMRAPDFNPGPREFHTGLRSVYFDALFLPLCLEMAIIRSP
jgi:hypothetical protein